MNPEMPAERPSRRQAIQAGAGFVIAPALLTAGNAPSQEKSIMSELRNPRDLYPRPPFKKQKQDPPGLASKMEPRPDHGEKSYKGSGRLTGRKALVTGGDSGLGRAAAIAFAREGADVAFGYLPAEEPDAKEVVELIWAAGRKAVSLPSDIRDRAGGHQAPRLSSDRRGPCGGPREGRFTSYEWNLLRSGKVYRVPAAFR